MSKKTWASLGLAIALSCGMASKADACGRRIVRYSCGCQQYSGNYAPVAREEEYYGALNGVEYGPFSESTMRQYIAEGRIDSVWHEGWQIWLTADVWTKRFAAPTTEYGMKGRVVYGPYTVEEIETYCQENRLEYRYQNNQWVAIQQVIPSGPIEPGPSRPLTVPEVPPAPVETTPPNPFQADQNYIETYEPTRVGPAEGVWHPKADDEVKAAPSSESGTFSPTVPKSPTIAPLTPEAETTPPAPIKPSVVDSQPTEVAPPAPKVLPEEAPPRPLIRQKAKPVESLKPSDDGYSATDQNALDHAGRYMNHREKILKTASGPAPALLVPVQFVPAESRTLTLSPARIAADFANDDRLRQQAVRVEGCDLDLWPAEKEMFEAVNRQRLVNGRPPLILDAKLVLEARDWTWQMQQGRVGFHHSGEGAENIAWDGSGETVSKVMMQWMKSSGHRKNILNPNYRRFGGGLFGNYATQRFE